MRGQCFPFILTLPKRRSGSWSLYWRTFGSILSNGRPFTRINPCPRLQWATAVAVFWNAQELKHYQDWPKISAFQHNLNLTHIWIAWYSDAHGRMKLLSVSFIFMTIRTKIIVTIQTNFLKLRLIGNKSHSINPRVLFMNILCDIYLFAENLNGLKWFSFLQNDKRICLAGFDARFL